MKGEFSLRAAVGVVLLLLLSGVLFIAYWKFGYRGDRLSSRIPERQPLPEQSPLELPPLVELPSPSTTVHKPKTPPDHSILSIKPAPNKTTTTFAPFKPPTTHVPTSWDILNSYRQAIELDTKYYRIAVDSDRYGHTNQALIYYKKYLSIAPNGSHASQVKARLSQLESPP